MLIDNYNEVYDRVKAACEKSKRNIEDVTIIAVSKTKPVQVIEELYESKIRDFGENKVQELCEKYEYMDKDDIKFHLIGHLQRNKVKYIVDKTSLIHSVDSLRLAQQISEEAIKKNVSVDILIQVNVSQEESKFGIDEKETFILVEEISKLPNIYIKGLMTIAPYTLNPEENRAYFRELKKLSVDIKEKNIDNVSMCHLSMGMTGDFEVAVEEGATLIRVGTAIFGERNYN